MTRSFLSWSFTWLLTLILGLLILYWHQRFASASYVALDSPFPKERLISQRLAKDTTLNIAFIGDSWIHNGEVADFVQADLSRAGMHIQTKSFGYCGATSRDLYQMITQPSPLSHLAEQNWEYVVIVIGVNDASGQYGPDFYAQHTLWIAERIISMGAFPIIVELPTFAIEESTALFPMVKRVRNQIFAWWQGCSINNISCYRDALRQKINESDLKDKILIVHFDQVCSQYSDDKELYRDFFHLNSSGNQKLATAIAGAIMEK
jgi:lysophospholipase L1-like esterase